MEQELLDTLHETFKTINARVADLEKVHTRYQGPKGERGPKGDSGPAGRDGKDSTELNTLREERNQFREELNSFRKEIYDFRTALFAELRETSERTATELADVYEKEVNAFCSTRDHACKELAALVGPQGPQGPADGADGAPGKPGDIRVAVAAAEAEARNVVQEELAKFRQEILALLQTEQRKRE